MKRIPARFLWALLPVAVGLTAALLIQIFVRPLPLLVFKVDFGTLLLFVSGTLSFAGLAYLSGGWLSERACKKDLAEGRRNQAEAHRRFLRRLDHEMKNPLTGMKAALVNLAESPQPREDAHTVLDLQRQVERLSRLAGDLRKLAELEDRPLEQSEVEAAGLLQETVEAISSLPSCSGRTVRLVVSEMPWPLPPVMGDRDLLGLALYNLVENALKYTAPEDEVEVRAREDGGALVVEVADSGPGIPLEEQPRIFEELYRGANARGFEGSGLGLALVHRIITRHRGKVSVRSRADGQKGTIFIVRLPGKAPMPGQKLIGRKTLN